MTMIYPKLTNYDMGAGVCAFSTTRHGGYSKGSYAEFNINPYCGDTQENVNLNRQAICQYFNIPSSRLVVPHQVHGTEVRVVDSAFLSSSTMQQAQYLEGVDALATQEYDVLIGVSTADCVPILAYDEPHHLISAIHAGWKGTQQRIAAKAVSYFVSHFSTDPQQLKIVLGPSIGPADFEVGEDVYDAFAKASFSMDQITLRKGSKWHIDLWKAITLQLQEAGVPASRIYVSGISTYSHVDNYFSARRLTIHSGRIFSGIILKNMNK